MSDNNLNDFFEEIKLSQLENSQAALAAEYPGFSKALLVFPLGGDVLDAGAHEFEFIDTTKKSSNGVEFLRSKKMLLH